MHVWQRLLKGYNCPGCEHITAPLALLVRPGSNSVSSASVGWENSVCVGDSQGLLAGRQAEGTELDGSGSLQEPYVNRSEPEGRFREGDTRLLAVRGREMGFSVLGTEGLTLPCCPLESGMKGPGTLQGRQCPHHLCDFSGRTFRQFV